MAHTARQRETLLETLATRFRKHPERHEGIGWDAVQARLEAAPKRLEVLQRMEASGGEPDVVASDPESGEMIFFDCAAESPTGRRSLCYDREARTTRKENAPESSAVEMATAIGIALLGEAEYRKLQTLGTFDLKTSSWIQTPPAIRKLGGALFCDCRYGHVFVYHNGAPSYYAARGFRGSLRV